MKELRKDHWRSLDELADTPSFREFLHREFPKGTTEFIDNDWSRRSFLKLMGASMALAGLASCRRPVEKIVPHFSLPEAYEPGTPVYYATSMPFGTDAFGMLVKSTDGRPTKIEGNPDHPASRGAANELMLAAILELYDPDRSQILMKNGAPSTWDTFVAEWSSIASAQAAAQGGKLAILSRSFASPTLARLRSEFLTRYPQATWVAYDPIHDESQRSAMRDLFGADARPVYDLRTAQVILSLDADIVHAEPGSLTAARELADTRRVLSQSDTMSRLYVVESAYSLTGGMADHRVRLKSSQIGGFLLALAQVLASQGLSLPWLGSSQPPAGIPIDQKLLGALANDLMAHRSTSAILVGRRQPSDVHLLAMGINAALGNIGTTVSIRETTETLASSTDDLLSLVNRMKSGGIDTLILLGSNPVYDAPASLNFGGALAKVAQTIHAGHYFDETARACQWHLNTAHFLESWGDTRGLDGTIAPIQPLIAPLYDGKSETELASLFATGLLTSGMEIVQTTWKGKLPASQFEAAWKQALHDGVVAGSGFAVTARPLSSAALSAAATQVASRPGITDLEAIFVSSKVWDGRFANNGWLQELPDPITKVTWDNPALLSFATAGRLGLKNGDMASISLQGRTMTMPVWISPGQADDTVVLPLGYGRSQLGAVARKAGFDTYQLRRLEGQYIDSAVQVSKGSGSYLIAQTQEHGTMGGFDLGDADQDKEKRPFIREALLADYKAASADAFADDHVFHPAPPHHPPLRALWTERAYDTGYQWGMAIDLNACTGCGACAVACQSENNIPIVGKDQVDNGREMNWIRIDRYYSGTVHEPEMAVQPVPCMQCENAPCESVCPVAATVHDDEGLNAMVYNRCIGTRYCSNNCPYKVRRFNFFNYNNDHTVLEQMKHNPDVTLRFRGVMEKCTYCVQRITTTRIAAKRDDRLIRDLEVQTACQQACPSGAIMFGNINDPNSTISRWKKVNRDYGLLKEYNTRPRTSYLARLRNPHPDLAAHTADRAAGEQHG